MSHYVNYTSLVPTEIILHLYAKLLFSKSYLIEFDVVQ